MKTVRELIESGEILEVKISKDGDKWCVLRGDNLQDGVAAFGDSPTEALEKILEEKLGEE